MLRTFLAAACVAAGAFAPVVSAAEPLPADTPGTTVLGDSFIAPKGWDVTVRGPATILEAPEGDSRIALVDVKAKDVDAALAAAWSACRDDAPWPVKVTTDGPDKDG